MKIHDCQQGTPYWHTVRLGKVTGSMFGVAKGNGQGRIDYMDDLIEERRSGKPRESFVNKHMQRGTKMEPFARAEYEKEYRVKVQEVGFVEFNEDIGVSPDGMVGDSGVIEIKCPTLENHNKYIKADKLPSPYKPQAQGTLWVTGRKWLDFVSYHPDAGLFVKRVYPDEAYIKELKIRIYMFIADMKAMMKEKETKMSEGSDFVDTYGGFDSEDMEQLNRKGSTMQHTGTITSVMPRLKDGYAETFNTQNGTFYVFEMTVNTQAGPITGQINSKSPQYPKNQGEQITVEVTSDQHGNKFKNINPQYAGQNQTGQQAPPQQQPQGQPQQNQQQTPPQQQSYTPPPQTPPRDTGLSIERQASFKAACHRFQGMAEATNAEIMTLAALGANFCVTGHVGEAGSAEQFAQDYDLPPELG